MADTNSQPTITVTDEQARSLAEEIVAKSAASKVALMSAVGERLFTEVFRSDPALWRSQSKTKGASLEKIAQQPGMADAQWSRFKLHDAIEIYLMSKALDGLAAFPHLQPGHLVLVAGLELAEQQRLLAAAEQGRWSVRQISEAVGNKHSAAPSADAHALAELGTALRELARWSDESDGLVADLLRAGIPQDAAAPLAQDLQSLGARVQQLQQRLAQARPASKPA